MSADPRQLFRSSGLRGYSAEVTGHPQHVRARKFEREVQVRFATSEGTVTTHEGIVYAHPGDAIITGIAGEQWCVSRARFADKYRPLPPTIAGQAGTYVNRPYEIRALRMQEPFDVLLADGISLLSGRPDDWLVDYGDGSLGVIAPGIFATTYDILS